MVDPGNDLPRFFPEDAANREQAVARFERAWQSGAIPAIDDYLDGEGDGRLSLLIELVHADLECRLKRGEAIRVESYLERYPELETKEEWTLALIEAEYRLRGRRELTLNAAEYLERFPAYRRQLAHLVSTEKAPSNPGNLASHAEAVTTDPTALCTSGEGGAEKVDPVPVDLPTHIGRYQVSSIIGRGGFGVVYLAHDDQLRRLVAIKVPHAPRSLTRQDAALYVAEARTTANLDHPRIVPVYDVGSSDDYPIYIVSKYIAGKNLYQQVRDCQSSHVQSARWIAELAESLHHAHKRGVVHRDVKPGNILIDEAGKAFLVDFGLALRERDRERHGREAGTPAYMSPEQARREGHRVDGRSDVFSLGVVFYELLAGRRPFQGESHAALYEQITSLEPKPPRQIDDSIPKELERICLKALSKRASDRYTTAKDMAEDLHCFLTVRVATPSPERMDRVQQVSRVDADSLVLAVDAAPPRIVPKGLRFFDEHDAEFFLDLLPGPRDRQGLPESIRFWKTRIEETDADRTFSVGLIYGPSGCGKTSLFKAGLLPRLASHVAVVYLEASDKDTEQRLLKGLRKVARDVPVGTSLPKVLSGLREGRWTMGRRKTLIVLDQFEQWLYARRAEQDTQLVQGLRQCDGSRLQAVVLVRDDFWLAATRFMRDLEVPVLENHNSAVVDLFDPLHARNVLAAFGRAYRRLPDETTALSQEQETFLDRAVEGLAQDGKIICVRLALFADMLKGRPWTMATLAQAGGTEGLGLTFLEETFSASTAPAAHRHHEKAAQAVLRTLLPEAGTDIKGSRQSYATLLDASGYVQRPDEFSELIRILDSEIRLITPTVPEGEDAGTDHDDPADEKYYQLTHDYLVPSLRDWLTRKQKETRRGRAELRLAERSALWNAKPENQQLPSWWEDLSIRWYTDHKKWNEPQRKMMRRAGWVHGSRSLLTAIMLLLLAWGGFEIHGRLQASKVLAADPSTLSSAIAQLSPWQMWGKGYLADIIQRPAQTDDERREQLHARLASASLSGTYDPEVLAALYDCSLPYVGVIRDVLQPHRDQFAASLWNALHDASQPVQRRFRCGLLLAGCEPSSSQWQPEGYRFLTERLLDTSFEFQGVVRQYLRPLREQLVPQLETYLGNEAVRESWQVSAATALADLDFSGADGSSLAQWLTQASDNQYAKLYDVFEAKADPQAVSRLKQLVAQTPTDQSQAERVKLGRRRAGAAITLLRKSERGEVPEDMFAALRVSDDPESLSQFAHGCRGRTITAQQLWQCVIRADQLRQATTGQQRVIEDRVLFGLLLALGDTPSSELPLEAKDSWVAQLTEWYASDPSSAIHGATGWLLRKWGFVEAVTRVDRTPLPYDATGRREWFVVETNPKTEGIMTAFLSGLLGGPPPAISKIYFTFVVFPPGEFMMGSPEGEAERCINEQLHRVQLTRPLAVSMHEVTWAQYDPVDGCQLHYNFEQQFRRELRPADPAIGVKWFEAVEYCRWLTVQLGFSEGEQCYEDPQSLTKDADGNPRHTAYYPERRGFRLPTEAEWEYVCRSGTGTAYSFGNDPNLLADYGWFAENSDKWLHAVGQLRPNLRGLFDVHGNLYEWTQDWYDNYSGDTLVDPTSPPGAPEGSLRVFRGGTWNYDAADCQTARRYGTSPTARSFHCGFRLALSPSGGTPEAVEDKSSEAGRRRHGGSAAEPRPEMP